MLSNDDILQTNANIKYKQQYFKILFQKHEIFQKVILSN